MIKEFIVFILKKKNEIIWFFEKKIMRKKLDGKLIKSIDFNNAIILMPHSDDEWIGCSQILIDNSKKKYVIDMDMDGGDDCETHSIRKIEYENMKNSYKYSSLLIGVDKTEELSAVICKIRPDIIFLPCIFDWHEEHLDVMEILKNSIFDTNYKGMVGMYQVSLPIPYEMINYVIPMNKIMQKSKWRKFLYIYKSQQHIPIKRFASYEYVNGKFTDSYAAESYAILNSKSWIEMYDKFRLSKADKEFCKNNLNNIITIRNFIETKFSVFMKNK